jgi:cytosylglucuronate decarboxylase
MTPDIVIIRILEACNAGCFMCPFARSEEPYRYPLAEAAQLAAGWDGRAGPKLVRLTGGETLMHPAILELIETFRAAGPAVSTITNGWHLPDQAEDLAAAGLNQVVVSLDAPDSEHHDRYRQLAGLFERAVHGLERFRPLGRTRVNTVVGAHNYGLMIQMYELLRALGVEQWSIIPLKLASDQVVGPHDPARAIEAYAAFQAHLRKHPDGPAMVGFSGQWMGRSQAEVTAMADGAVPFRPRGDCQVVDRVRYLTPAQQMVYRWPADDQGPTELTVVNRLRSDGPKSCRGCEPANAYLGETAIDLADDPFLF